MILFQGENKTIYFTIYSNGLIWFCELDDPENTKRQIILIKGKNPLIIITYGLNVKAIQITKVKLLQLRTINFFGKLSFIPCVFSG